MFTRTRFFMIAVSFIAMAIGPQFAFSTVTIDDFKTGTTGRIRHVCGVRTYIQRGLMVGGTRLTHMTINEPPLCLGGNPYRQTASLQVRKEGMLLLNNDYGVHARLDMRYGQDKSGANAPLNLDLTEGSLNDRIRLTFKGNDLYKNSQITVYMHDGTSRSSCGFYVPPMTDNIPFTMDFPFSIFNVEPALGPSDYTDVDYISLMFQSGSAIGSNDLALTSVVATNGASPATILLSSCS